MTWLSIYLSVGLIFAWVAAEAAERRGINVSDDPRVFILAFAAYMLVWPVVLVRAVIRAGRQ
jgi:hypothetical protein